MDRLTKDQRQAVLDEIRTMPTGYTPEQVANELDWDWRNADAREAWALAREAGVPGA